MTSLKQHFGIKHQLSALCGEAVQLQIERGNAAPTQLRQRRRHLLKALRKRLPQSVKRSPEKMLHTAVMVLALWGFGGLAMPGTAQAAAVFEHTMLEGFTVGSNGNPILVDIDGDGDLDAFVGEEFGTVKFYQNNGTTSAPVFAAADGISVVNPLDGINVGLDPSPAFVDIDGDGDLDAFIGEQSGTVKFYQNNGSASAPSFVAADGTTVINPLGAFNMTNWAAPAFADIDNDGDLDLFAGVFSGVVKFYQNNGSATAPSFVAADGTTVINPLAGFDVGLVSAPTFTDIDNDGDLDAFVGQNGGLVKFYQNNGSASAPSFVAADGITVINPLAGFDVGQNAAPSFADIDNDGDLDAFVGEGSGEVRLYQNNGSVTAPDFVAAGTGPLAGVDVGTAATPAFVDIDDDGDLDAFSGRFYYTVSFYQNNGTVQAPNLTAADGTFIINPLDAVYTGYASTPTFADIDNDGDLDAFVGDEYGAVMFYQNTGTASAPSFVVADGLTVINPLAGFDVGTYATPTFADIDNDGDLDAFVGDAYGTVQFYQNTGTASAPSFVAADGVSVINPLTGFDVGYYAVPTFADIDNDGDLDAFVGEGNGTVKFYQNNGSATAPNFVAADGVTVINPLTGFDVGFNAAPTFADIDNDSDLDAFVGTGRGTVMFIENRQPHPPVAVDDTASTEKNTVLTSITSLLANDTAHVGGTLSAVAGSFATTQGGSIVINSDGNYTYTPPANFTGTDTVDYTVSDGSLTAVGALTINVTEAASSGGGGAFGLALLWSLLLPSTWRRRRVASSV